MTIRKARWHATLQGRIRHEGRSIILPATLIEDSGREVEIRIPRSRLFSLLGATVNQAKKIDQKV